MDCSPASEPYDPAASHLPGHVWSTIHRAWHACAGAPLLPGSSARKADFWRPSVQ